MSQVIRGITANELLTMPDDGKRYELVQGELRMMSPAGRRHGRISPKIARRIADYVEQHFIDLGPTMPGFRLDVAELFS